MFSKLAKSPSRGSVEAEKVADAPRDSAVNTSSVLDRLPPWVSTNLRSPKSWKVVFRCWVACWATFVILLPHKSLNALGTTAFFALLASFFLPPAFPVQIFIILMSTLLLGMLCSWGLGVAAMRAANAVRDQGRLQRVMQEVQSSISSSAAGRANPAGALKAAIFHGVFLDINASAIYGCFLGIGSFIFGFVRAYAPKLQFFSIFGTIGIDIFCVIGPLFPTAEYILLNSVLKSVSTYTAVAILATIFVFPETLNHLCMSMMSGQLAKAKALMLLQDEVLDADVKDLAPGTPLITKIKGARAAIIGTQQQLMAMSGNINLEFSRGKWNGDDVRELEPLLLGIVVRMVGLLSFSRFSGQGRWGAQSEATASSSVDTLAAPTTNDSYVLRQIHQHQHEIEVAHSLRIQDMLPIIKESTADLRRACAAGITAVQASLDSVNTQRWKTNRELDAQHARHLDEAIVRLVAELAAFKGTHRKRMIEPFLPLILAAKTKQEQETLPLRSLYLAYVFGTNLILSSNVILTFMERVIETTTKRQNNRFWAPKGLRAIGKLLTARGDKDDGTFGEDTSPQPDASKQTEEAYARDPDSKPPTNLIQRIMDSIHKLWKWTKTAEAAFTFKYVFVSIALWIPSVCKKTAAFYYDQKGVWALIMAQTILNVYAADQIFNLFTRTIGTFVGLIFGLLAWYIGNGSGTGNPYGAAASYGAILIPVIFVRLYAPTQYLAGVVLGCATFALVVGYSWVDGHTIQVFTPGIGWSVAWKRWVLVMIGCLASFVVMMFPPKSGRKAVRLRNASSVVALSKIYGFLISTWISSSAHHKGAADAPADWIGDFRNKLIAQAQEINTIKDLTDLAKWEGGVRGAWPSEEYLRLSEVQTEMTSGLAQLGGALGHLEDNWRLTLLHSTRVLNPNFIADVMSIFSLVSQSLRTGEPMHQVLPSTLVERLFYHHRRDTAYAVSDKNHHIDIDHVQSLDYMYYANGLVAVYQLLQSLDELHKITKKLCGEVPLQGFAAWREDYERKHIPV